MYVGKLCCAYNLYLLKFLHQHHQGGSFSLLGYTDIDYAPYKVEGKKYIWYLLISWTKSSFLAFYVTKLCSSFNDRSRRIHCCRCMLCIIIMDNTTSLLLRDKSQRSPHQMTIKVSLISQQIRHNSIELNILKYVTTLYDYQLVDIFAKSLSEDCFNFIRQELAMFNADA